MIIISDTTPVHYLILIGKETLLRELFGEIVIPEAVASEMRHERTPDAVRRFIDSPPDWVLIKSVKSNHYLQSISGLGAGETEAIALALEENADAVLMDDRKAVRKARGIKLNVLTTLAILELAAAKQMIDLQDVLDELSKTNFRLPSQEIVDELLKPYRK